MSLSAPAEGIYPDLDTAFKAIQHAKQHGYALLKRDKKPSRVVLTCDRAGEYDAKGKRLAVHQSKQRKGTGTKKTGCLMKVEIRQDTVTNQWVVQVLERAHNHSPSVAPSAHPAHIITAPDQSICDQISTLSEAGFLPS